MMGGSACEGTLSKSLYTLPIPPALPERALLRTDDLQHLNHADQCCGRTTANTIKLYPTVPATMRTK